jgi:hypothetical protein
MLSASVRFLVYKEVIPGANKKTSSPGIGRMSLEDSLQQDFGELRRVAAENALAPGFKLPEDNGMELRSSR